jgi:hypothetical protein
MHLVSGWQERRTIALRGRDGRDGRDGRRWGWLGEGEYGALWSWCLWGDKRRDAASTLRAVIAHGSPEPSASWYGEGRPRTGSGLFLLVIPGYRFAQLRAIHRSSLRDRAWFGEGWGWWC